MPTTTFNSSNAAIGAHIIEFNRNWGKAFYTETGLYTDYETTKESIQFWDWAREVTGIPTTGDNSNRLTRRTRTPGPNTGGGIQRGVNRGSSGKY